MRILVIGSGAREHAILQALRADPTVDDLHVAPGNAGTGELATNHDVQVADPASIAALAGTLEPDLVVVGPEVPLVAGVVDVLRDNGIAVFGPTAAAARIEGSKAFAKDVMAAAGVPTGTAIEVTDPDRLDQAFDSVNPGGRQPYVVKDDALAAGKGVVVTDHREQARAHALEIIGGGRAALVEQYLAGPEVSLFAICDGGRALPLLPAQDFKRIGDGDTGPNTGGMGAYAPLPWAPPDLVATATSTVIEPVLAEMAARGCPFTGLLYAGLVLTADGLKVIEFNCRFGDPETQVVLALLQTPLAGVLAAAAAGDLSGTTLSWKPGAAVTVVVAAEGYPGAPVTGDPIGLPAGLAVDPEAVILHAGTAAGPGGEVRSAGGRVLSVTATGKDAAAARARAYRAVAQVQLRGAQYRSDIAAGI